MHICFITGEYPTKGLNGGGIGTFVNFLAEKLVSKKISVSVIGFYNINYEKFEKVNDINVYRLPKSKWKFARFYDHKKRILKKINSIRPIDIIEGSELSFAFFPTKTNYKKIIRLHGGHHFFANELNKKPALWRSYQEKTSFKKSDAYIAVSEYVGNQTKKYLNINFNFKTIYNIIDTEKFKNKNTSKFIKNSLLFVGTICEKKGVRQLVQSIPIIKKQFPDILLNIVGRDWLFPNGTSYIEYLKTFISDKDKNNINIIGPVSHKEVPKHIAKSNICIYPSHMESFGLTLVEAMSMEKFVIASNIKPFLEILNNNETGLLVNPFSPEDIAEKIIQTLVNTEEANIRAINARKDILKRFDVDAIINQNIEFYKSVL